MPILREQDTFQAKRRKYKSKSKIKMEVSKETVMAEEEPEIIKEEMEETEEASEAQ